MTLPEDEYSDLVEEMLIAEYGEKNVERQVYINEVRRYADFVVRAWPVDLAIEVENDFEAVFKGVSQALVYANQANDMAPVIIRPPLKDKSDKLENRILSSHVTICEFAPTEWK